MADHAEFNLKQIRSTKEEIVTAIAIQGIDALAHTCEDVIATLYTKNMEMESLYCAFGRIQDAMSNIADIMQEDPEAAASNGSAYTKRR